MIYWNNVAGIVLERADINSHSISKYMMVVIITCDNFCIPTFAAQGCQVIKLFLTLDNIKHNLFFITN